MMQDNQLIDLIDVPSFKALAVRTGLTPDKSGTRIAWSKLTELVPLDDERLVEGPKAYVFIPQEQWGRQVDTLWVGLAVREYGSIPEGVEALDIPGGLCASTQVHGDEASMWKTYDYMFKWLEHNPDYKLDQREGVFGMETVPFEPFNPLTVPYSTIQTFDFTMLYPVICKAD